MSWQVITLQDVTHEQFQGLFDNQIAAIRVPNFISLTRCNNAVQAIHKHGITYYENVLPKVGKIGIAQTEFLKVENGRDTYFEKSQEAEGVRKQILSDCGDFMNDVVSFMSQFWEGKVKVLRNQKGQKYFAGIIRVINAAMLHSDWAKRDAPGWENQRIKAQLGWNIYLQIGDNGGELVIYRRLWESADEVYKRTEGGYGYTDEVVSDAECVTISPDVGELVLFNSQNYHKVLSTNLTHDRERVSVSSFIGLDEREDSLWLWS